MPDCIARIFSATTLSVLFIVALMGASLAEAAGPKVRLLMRLQQSTEIVLPGVDSMLVTSDSNLSAFKDCVTEHTIDSIVRVSVEALRHYYVLYIDSSDVNSVIAVLDTVSFVDQIVLMPMAQRHGSFNDKSFSNQWGLQAINAFKAFDISAIPVQDPDCKCSPEVDEPKFVTIAVLDDAFCLDHEELDLGNDYIESYNVNDLSSDVAPAGSEGLAMYDLHEKATLSAGLHGTFVAATAVAKAHNGVGIIGTGHGAKLMAIDVFEDGGMLEPIDAVAGLTYAVTNGADVISMSFGIEYYQGDGGRALMFAKAINDWFVWYNSQALYRKTGKEKRAVFIASAGNNTRPGNNYTDKKNPMYPANNFGVIAVGDITIGDHVSSQSMIGGNATFVSPGVYLPAKKFGDPARPGSPEEQVSGQSFVEIYAPGTEMMSAMATTFNSAYTTATEKKRYSVASGTSFATPLVAGIVARMLMIYPNLTQSDVVAALKAGAVPGLNDFYRANYGRYYDADSKQTHDCTQSAIDLAIATYKLGYGKLNAFECLKYVRDVYPLPNPCPTPMNPSPTVILKTTAGVTIVPSTTQIAAGQTIKVSTQVWPANYVVTLFARSDRPTANEYAIATYTSDGGTTAPSHTFVPNGGGIYTFTVSICVPNCKRRYVGSVSAVVSYGGSGCQILRNGSFETRTTFTNPQATYTALNEFLDQTVQRYQDHGDDGFQPTTPQAQTPPWFRPVGSPRLLGTAHGGIKAYHGNWYASMESDTRQPEASSSCADGFPSKVSSGNFKGQQQLAIPFKFRKGNKYEICYAVRLSKKETVLQDGSILPGESVLRDGDFHEQEEHHFGYRLYAANGVGASVTKYPLLSPASRLNGDENTSTYGGATGTNPWAEKIAPKNGQQIQALPRPDPLVNNYWHGIPYNAGAGTIIYEPTNDYEYFLIAGNTPGEAWQIDIDNIRITTGCAIQLPGDVRICRGSIVNPPFFNDGLLEADGGIPGAKVTWTLIVNNTRTTLGMGRIMPIGAFWAALAPPKIGTYEIEVKIDDNERLCNAIVHRFKITSENCDGQSACTECDDLEVNAVYNAATCCYTLEVTNANNCYARIRELTFTTVPSTLEFGSANFKKQGDKFVGDVIVMSNETFTVGTLCLNGTSQPAMILNVGIRLQGVADPCPLEVSLSAQQCLACCPEEADVSIIPHAPSEDCEKCCYDIKITRPLESECISSSYINLEWAGDGTGAREVRVPFTLSGANAFAIISDICVGKTLSKKLKVSFSRALNAPFCTPPFEMNFPNCQFTLNCSTLTVEMDFNNAAQVTYPDGTIQGPRCCGWIRPIAEGCVLSPNIVDVFVNGQKLVWTDPNGYAFCLKDGQALGSIVIKDKAGNVLCTKSTSFLCSLSPPPGQKLIPRDSTVQTGAIRDASSMFEVVSLGADGWEIRRLDSESDDFGSVLIIDIAGRVVSSEFIMAKDEVRVICDPSLAHGIYFLVIRTMNGTSIVKPVVR